MLRRYQLISLAVLTLFGCQSDENGQTTGYVLQQQPIVNGTRDPQAVALTEGQQNAIGWLHSAGYPHSAFCTGTIISPTVVATASHCLEGVRAGQIGFSVGQLTTDPLGTFGVEAIHIHPRVDAALLVLDQSAIEAVDGLSPILANRTSLTNDLVGSPIQAGGYGQTRDPARTGRWFATVYLAAVGDSQIIVDGRGDQGICFGDSGGPAIAELQPGIPVLLGVESHGDGSCVDNDWLTRIDAIYEDFIEPVVGGGVQVGLCDPLDYEGQCLGEEAEWCEGGVVLRRDCTTLGTTCGLVSEEIGFACACDVGEFGRCAGNIAQWCENGHLRQLNCEARGEICGWAGADHGYFCDRRARCGPNDTAEGRCEGDVILSCVDSRLDSINCRARGMTCGSDEGGEIGCVEGTAVADPDTPATDDELDGPTGDSGEGDASLAEDDESAEGESGCQTTGSQNTSTFAFVLMALALLKRREPASARSLRR